MKTKYKWIRFERKKDCSEEWSVINKSDQWLGDVYYKHEWRQWVFLVDAFVGHSYFNFRCLEDIADFLKQLNKTKGCYKGK